MPPIKLTDDELDAVFAAARPLDPDLRDPFLRAVASALKGREVVGPGLVARTCRELQPSIRRTSRAGTISQSGVERTRTRRNA